MTPEMAAKVSAELECGGSVLCDPVPQFKKGFVGFCKLKFLYQILSSYERDELVFGLVLYSSYFWFIEKKKLLLSIYG